jgi:hypothetical protein
VTCVFAPCGGLNSAVAARVDRHDATGAGIFVDCCTATPSTCPAVPTRIVTVAVPAMSGFAARPFATQAAKLVFRPDTTVSRSESVPPLTLGEPISTRGPRAVAAGFGGGAPYAAAMPDMPELGSSASDGGAALGVALDADGNGALPVAAGDTVVSAGALVTAGAVGAVAASDALFV